MKGEMLRKSLDCGKNESEVIKTRNPFSYSTVDLSFIHFFIKSTIEFVIKKRKKKKMN
jgi:hypothetical protein